MEYRFLRLADEISIWNEDTFPDATETEQLLKTAEEFEELHRSLDELGELADCFIASAALSKRYGSSLGDFLLKAIVKHAAGYSDELYQAVKDKMDINRRRSWGKQPDGTYKHKEEETKMNEETKTYQASDYDACVFIAMKDGKITGKANGNLINLSSMLASVLAEDAKLLTAFSLAVAAAKVGKGNA